MHEKNPEHMRVFKAELQAALQATRAGVYMNPDRIGNHAVHGSQFEKYVLPGTFGKAMSTLIAAYTLLNPLSVVPARDLLCRTGTLRSTSIQSFLASA